MEVSFQLTSTHPECRRTVCGASQRLRPAKHRRHRGAEQRPFTYHGHNRVCTPQRARCARPRDDSPRAEWASLQTIGALEEVGGERVDEGGRTKLIRAEWATRGTLLPQRLLSHLVQYCLRTFPRNVDDTSCTVPLYLCSCWSLSQSSPRRSSRRQPTWKIGARCILCGLSAKRTPSCLRLPPPVLESACTSTAGFRRRPTNLASHVSAFSQARSAADARPCLRQFVFFG